MPERYLKAIIETLSDKNYQPLKVRQLARRMGVPEADYDEFRDAVKRLRDEGRVVMASRNALALPPMANKVTGLYRANPRGFGFVMPSEPNAHGDLFIPEGENLDAITGDTVVARVLTRGMRAGKMIYHGRVIQVVERGHNRFVGELDRSEREQPFWFVLPQGRGFTDPIIIDDVGPAGKVGEKVVVEIVRYPAGRDLAHGVIVEALGKAGPIDVETQAAIREHGLPDEFSDDAMQDARGAVHSFDPDDDPDRADYTGWTVATIDPDDARDYDDAISIERRDGRWTLGVHIADVVHFVPAGGELDEEARARGNSTYFPRRVVPMLPEVLSNGVCSLQEGQVRYVRSALIDYDDDGNVLGTRFANARIRSAKRLTYREAQGILDGKVGRFDGEVVRLVTQMGDLARRIEQRRRKAGMLHLDLPERELVLTDDGRVKDVVPADDSYTHTIIEMFMVEANEAVARHLDRRDVPFLRRIHPEKEASRNKHLHEFIQACGLKIPKDMSRYDMQALIEKVRGRPESYAVNLALLKTFEQAEYSPMRVGHFALASDCYCHFTSPIRRYPDLTVHRLLDKDIRGQLDAEAEPDTAEVARLGEHCSFTERRSAAAEGELRTLLVLQFLTDHVGEVLEGVVTGITTFGVFVQLTRYLVEGLVRLEDLGDDWWEPSPEKGQVVAQRSGKRLRMGDAVTVRVHEVDLSRRQLNLTMETLPGQPAPGGKKSKGRGGSKAAPSPGEGTSPKADKGGRKGGRAAKSPKRGRRGKR